MKPEPQIRLETKSGVPAWRQIATQIRTLAVEGVLVPGYALPPLRRLALDLGVHFNTVAEAYRALEQEGILEIVHGHGARIAGRGPLAAAGPEVSDEFRLRMRELIATVRAKGLNTRKIAAEMKLFAKELEGL